MVAWARKVATEPGRVHETEAIEKADVIAFSRPGGEVRYQGYSRYASRWRVAWTLERLHALVSETAVLCERTWGWHCPVLTVACHEHAKTKGLAYEPGSGARTGERAISIDVGALLTWGVDGIREIVAHELCHHYRDETFPPAPTGGQRLRGLRSLDGYEPSHDRVFCRELERVVPEAVDPVRGCAYIRREADPEVLAAADRRREERGIKPTFAPQAGILVLRHLKSGKMQAHWEPRAGSHWRRTVFPVSGVGMLALARSFPVEQWPSVTVERASDFRMAKAASNLQEFLQYIVIAWPRHMQDLKRFLVEVGKAT
jgi:hypothetical protein